MAQIQSNVIELLEQLGSESPSHPQNPETKSLFHELMAIHPLIFVLKFWIKEISDGLSISSRNQLSNLGFI